MLTDIRSGYQHFCKRDRVVRQEVEAEQIFRLGISVNDTGHIDDKTNGLRGENSEDCPRSNQKRAYELSDIVCGEYLEGGIVEE